LILAPLDVPIHILKQRIMFAKGCLLQNEGNDLEAAKLFTLTLVSKQYFLCENIILGNWKHL
jgi:hypothetical protein